MNIVAFNPAVFAFILAAALVALYKGRFRGRARRRLVAHMPSSMAAQSLPAEISFDLSPEQPLAAAVEKEEDRVLQLYRNLVESIMRSSGLTAKANHTLRELALSLKPQLNGTSGYLWQMTLIVETAIYSGRSLTQREREDMERLSHGFQESRKHGPA